MKKTSVMFMAAVIAYCSSCGQKCCIAPIYDYHINALKNDTAWGANPGNSKISTIGDTITVMGSSDDIPAKQMGFKFKYAGNGKYILTGQNGFYYYSIGPSSFMNYITVDSTAAESYAIVQKFDRAGNSVSGTFNLRLTRSPGAVAGSVNQVRFLNGNFKVPLHN